MQTSAQMDVLAGLALDYLIGADGEQRGKEGRITETPLGVGPASLGSSIAYCNLRCEDGEPREYAPYLPHDDIFEQYGEGRPDPEGEGFKANIVAQLDRCRKLGHTLVEQDNPDSFPLPAVILGLNWAQERGLGVIAKNPHLMKDGALTYVVHPNIFGIIVEEDCGTPAEMDELRRKAGKPALPVWFVSYGNGHGWAMQTAQEIKSARYLNMGVTYSSTGEYGSSADVLLPEVPLRPMLVPNRRHAGRRGGEGIPVKLLLRVDNNEKVWSFRRAKLDYGTRPRQEGRDGTALYRATIRHPPRALQRRAVVGRQAGRSRRPCDSVIRIVAPKVQEGPRDEGDTIPEQPRD
jgi:hypothetical protein